MSELISKDNHLSRCFYVEMLYISPSPGFNEVKDYPQTYGLGSVEAECVTVICLQLKKNQGVFLINKRLAKWLMIAEVISKVTSICIIKKWLDFLLK